MTATGHPGRFRQAALITLAAAAILAGFGLLPPAPALTHMDFLVQGPGSLQFCDPINPRFLAVTAARTPAVMTLRAVSPMAPGQPAAVALTLRTATGKPIGPADLLPAAGRKIQLWIVDESLADFQAAEPVPGKRPGEWSFGFTPKRPGVYRIFADFIPRPTGRELYVSADLGPIVGQVVDLAARSTTWPTGFAGPGSADRDSCHFSLIPSARPIYARQSVTLALTAATPEGKSAALEPAGSELVIFDQGRRGFVSLRSEPGTMSFKVTMPDAGHYVAWSRMRMGGREITAPFPFDVMP